MPTTSRKSAGETASAGKTSKKDKSKNKEDIDSNIESDENEDSKKASTSTSKSEVNRHFWNDTECTYLIAGIEVYGKGNWSRILKEFSDKFHKSRTNVHLKDKYRNLLRTPTILKLYEKKAQLVIKALNDEKNL
jgi:hypothetical protein